MTKYKILLTIFLILFVSLTLKSVVFPSLLFVFPCSSFDKAPRWIEGITAFIAIAAYAVGAFVARHYEKRIDPRIGTLRGYHWFWPFPRRLTARYKSVPGILFVYSLMMTSILFSVAIPLTVRLAHWRISAETQTSLNLPTFEMNEIIDLASYVAKLKKPSDAVFVYLMSRFSTDAKTAISGYAGSKMNASDLAGILSRELNAVVLGASIYESTRFSGITLRQETRDLLSHNPQGVELARLNRLLLEDHSPLELSRKPTAHLQPTDDFAKDNPINFLYSQGAIVSFVVICLGFFTFTNTLILRSKHEREIETLDELLFLLQDRLSESNDKDDWARFSHKFFYVLDHTIACGHYSAPNEFKKYAECLRGFMKRYEVEFKGLVYTLEKNKNDAFKLMGGDALTEAIVQAKQCLTDAIEQSKPKQEIDSLQANITVLQSKITALQTEIQTLLLKAHDVFLSYLNKTIYKDNGKPDRIMNKIRYCPFRTASIEFSDPFFETVLRTNTLNAPPAAGRGTDADDPTLPTKDYEEMCAVLQTDEIGLTRIIVCNLFVIQFIATAQADKKNVPAGYISEDIMVIERYKRAYDTYRKTHYV
jgi:hypothetical protein